MAVTARAIRVTTRRAFHGSDALVACAATARATHAPPKYSLHSRVHVTEGLRVTRIPVVLGGTIRFA